MSTITYFITMKLKVEHECVLFEVTWLKKAKEENFGN
jgi:hypothetical protein